jgi:energy-coupling factor transporter ATP-binding protein EcfA2
MVNSIKINNFRNFAEIAISDFALINVIVGDNGVGKTTVLEALYLAVSGHAQSPLILKQWRGLPSVFNTSFVDVLVDNLYGDLFHDSAKQIFIETQGRGFENRSLTIERTTGQVLIPKQNRRQRRQDEALGRTSIPESTIAPIALTWVDSQSERHTAYVSIGPTGVKLDGTGERLPNCHMFASQITVPPEESANQYSDLRKRREAEQFRTVFFSIFDQVKDLSVESSGPTPLLMVDIPWASGLIPLGAFSGGSNRAASILLSLTSRRDGLVLVDEIESGIYHERQERFSRGLCTLAKAYGSQLIMTSHSDEWIRHFVASIDADDPDVAFWRLSRDHDNKPTIRRFTARAYSVGMAAGEMR